MYNWNRLDNVLEQFVDDEVLIGCGLQVFQNNQLIYNQCVGSSTADGSRILTENTRMRIYSVTKTFTNVSLMMLYEHGLFALDDPIAEYLPEFSNPVVCVSKSDVHDVVPAKSPITIRHLLTMTSGIPYMAFLPGEGPVQEALLESLRIIESEVAEGKKHDLHDLSEVIAKTPLCFHPGEHWLYGMNLSVIGRLVEVLSGKRLSDYMQKNIWEPLGLSHTCFDYQVPENEVIAERAISKSLCELFALDVNNRMKATAHGEIYVSSTPFLPGEQLGFELPCGGIVSTLHDLGIYYAMLANSGSWHEHSILSRRTIDLMRANHLNSVQLADFAQQQNRGFGYGLGFRTMRNPAEAGFYMPKGSFGWDGASGCYALASPEHKLAFVFSEQSLPHHIEYTIPRVMAALHACMEI